MVKLSHDTLDAEDVWRRRGKNERYTDALHSIISTPLFQGDYIYGVDSYGELRCLKKMTGDRVWEDLTAVANTRWGNIHFVKNSDRIWMFNEAGELIISKLSPDGFHEISRAKIIAPTTDRPAGKVSWSHPAYAYKHIFVRNDKELLCVNLAK